MLTEPALFRCSTLRTVRRGCTAQTTLLYGVLSHPGLWNGRDTCCSHVQSFAEGTVPARGVIGDVYTDKRSARSARQCCMREGASVALISMV